MGENKKKETVKIVTNVHEYEFVVLDAIHGLGVYHQWISYLGKNVDTIAGAVREMYRDTEGEISAAALFKRLVSDTAERSRLEEKTQELRELLEDSVDNVKPSIEKQIKAIEEEIETSNAFVKLRELLVKVLTLDKLFELCGIFLAGAKVDEEECDDIGMCSLWRRRPDELYSALIFAIGANYPDYFPFMMEKLDTGESLSQE